MKQEKTIYKVIKRLLVFLVLTTLLLVSAKGNKAIAKYEEPSYTVVKCYDKVELRQYKERITAEITLEGDRQKCLNEGFTILADYIFGKNKRRPTNAMTSLVVADTQRSSTDALYRCENIPMTTPVTASSSQEKKWTIRFYMPSSYSLNTLPTPDNDRIRLIQIPPQMYAVLKFSGFSSLKNFDRNFAELEKILTLNNVVSSGARLDAYYDPPWTLPFLRRNEVLVSIPVN